MNFQNYNWDRIVTPIDVQRLDYWLEETKYDQRKSTFLHDGFSSGFDIGYRGPANRSNTSHNIPFTIGDKFELWNKIMKEVKEGRYAGPYLIEDLPFMYYVQSPVGLVPKAGNKTRLIFHLSFNFGEDEEHKSVNHHMPAELCSVRYQDLDCAILNTLRILKESPHGVDLVVFAKSDFSHAFRILSILVIQRYLLLMMAYHPITGEQFFFIDMCLLFGSSRSCALFQEFSNAIKHIVEYRLTGIFLYPLAITNYLHDFLFIAVYIRVCDGMVEEFLFICQDIGCPVSQEKTERAAPLMEFLGVLLDGKNKLLAIPEEKVLKASNLLNWAVQKRKVTVKFIQQLTGMLNFLNKVIVLGRTFMRGMYEQITMNTKEGIPLKQHHHVWLKKQFVLDCNVWLAFLSSARVNKQLLCRPFIDFGGKFSQAKQLALMSDAPKSSTLGMGAVFLEENSWIIGQWDQSFIVDCDPSIEFLELYTLTVAILTWCTVDKLANGRVIVRCDNEAVVHMINNTSSSCAQCHKLLRILVLDGIAANRRIFALHIGTKKNFLADKLSRMDLKRFWKLAPAEMNKIPDKMPNWLWPPQKIWNNNDLSFLFCREMQTKF